MIFNSIDFLIFFPVVTLVYAIIPRRARCIWLLITSYYFYMCWNAKYALLIAFSTIVTYAAGLLIGRLKDRSAKKWVMAGGFVINLSILFFFKYFDFVLNQLNKLLAHFAVQGIRNPFDILLPVGISFYTFQALGYLVDVYRGECEAEKNLMRYALFVSFFRSWWQDPLREAKIFSDSYVRWSEGRYCLRKQWYRDSS